MKTKEDIVNDSGYPLQLHLEEIINKNSNEHNWRVVAREHRWVNKETREDGYIDLILENRQPMVRWRLVIECKRRNGSWTFLLPPKNAFNLTPQARILKTEIDAKKIYWVSASCLPESYESAFCVPETGGDKDSRTLEKTSGELLLSVESLAEEELNLWQRTEVGQPTAGIFNQMHYLPIIITTAKLQVCKFDPMNVNTSDGKISTGDSEFDPVDYIRFCKNLDTNINFETSEKAYTLSDINKANDRFVIIVQAEKILEFLVSLSLYLM